MKIDLTEIYKGLDEWRAERGITAESQKEGYLVNLMEELGELASALRDYEKLSKADLACYDTVKKVAEHEIIDALCDIAVFTINAGADIPCHLKYTETDTSKTAYEPDDFNLLVYECACYAGFINNRHVYFNDILGVCAKLCEYYGYNFEIAMLETIKEISSRTGAYDENAKKWVKDESDEAKSKWYQANYELARISNE